MIPIARRILRRPVVRSYGLSDPLIGPEVLSAIQTVRPFSMVADEGLGSLYEQVLHCDKAGIEGALVECGVWHGGSVALMGLAHLAQGPSRRMLHLFDSFVGIPEPVQSVDGPRAVDQVSGRAKPALGGELRVAWDYSERGGPGSIADVSELLNRIRYDMAKVRFHEGWFQETVPLAGPTIGPIALLRLDGDWYESTKVCLEHLYEHVVASGFIVIDDYGAYEGCRLAVDEFLGSLQDQPYLNRVNDEIRYIIKPESKGER